MHYCIEIFITNSLICEFPTFEGHLSVFCYLTRNSNPQTDQPSPSGKLRGRARCCYPLVQRVERITRTFRGRSRRPSTREDEPCCSSWRAFKNRVMCGLETAIFMAKLKLLWTIAKSSKGVIWNVWDVGSDLWKAADHFMQVAEKLNAF